MKTLKENLPKERKPILIEKNNCVELKNTNYIHDYNKFCKFMQPFKNIIKPEYLQNFENTYNIMFKKVGYGVFVFILEGNNQNLYEQSGVNRPMFVYNPPNGDNTAFVVKNDPIGNEKEIELLTQKYIVRTRSDAGTLEARANDYNRLKAAIQSGAQIISTDYYKPDPRLGSFVIKLK